MMNKGIYIHIPFCKKKCGYCDFLSAPCYEEKHGAYFDALIKEISNEIDEFNNKLDKDKEGSTTTIYIGGGTPSICHPDEINKILEAVKTEEDYLEISMECNPESVNKDYIKEYIQCGVNRFSIGFQSLNNNELKTLGRIHDKDIAIKAYDTLRSKGAENINIDLMYGIPNQSISSWENTLKEVVALNPDHISAYSLIIEEGTPFYNKYSYENLNEEDENEMDILAGDLLESYGYNRYEISNYAKDGKECEHNKIYWRCHPYIGFGAGASSYFNNERFHNLKSIDDYINNPLEHVAEREKNLQNDMEEFMFMGLRMTEGISKDEFKKRFHHDINEIYENVIQKHINQNLLTDSDNRIMLTKKGRRFSNIVMSDFII